MKLFKKFLTIIKDEETTSINSSNSYIVALFVRAAKIDGIFHENEKTFILNLIKRYFSLEGYEATTLLNEAEIIEKNTSDLVQITKIIKDKIPYDERIELVEDLWKVVLSDNIRDPEENSFMRLSIKLIGINDIDSAIARKKVQEII